MRQITLKRRNKSVYVRIPFAVTLPHDECGKNVFHDLKAFRHLLAIRVAGSLLFILLSENACTAVHVAFVGLLIRPGSKPKYN